jgi:hypothetical protein
VGRSGKGSEQKNVGKAGAMTDKNFVLSIHDDAFVSQSNISGFMVIYDDHLQFHKLSEYWMIEEDAWKDAAERLRQRFLIKLES